MRNRTKRKADLVNQTAAAKIVGIARQNVAGLVARGELEGETVAGMLFITRKSAERAGAVRKAASEEKNSSPTADAAA